MSRTLYEERCQLFHLRFGNDWYLQLSTTLRKSRCLAGNPFLPREPTHMALAHLVHERRSSSLMATSLTLISLASFFEMLAKDLGKQPKHLNMSHSQYSQHRPSRRQYACPANQAVREGRGEPAM